MQGYLDSTLSQDPLFVEARRKHFAPTAPWRKLRAPSGKELGWFQLTREKFGPIPLPTLMPATGWDQRAPGFPGQLDLEGADALLKSLESENGWWLAVLNALTEDELSALIQAGVPRGFRFLARPYPLKVVAGMKNFQEYFRSQPTGFRTNFRKTKKDAEKASVEIRPQLSWQDIEAVYRARSPEMGAEDYTRDPRFLSFLRDYRDAALNEGRWRETGIYQNGRPIGFGLGVYVGRVFHGFQLAHDPVARRLRPGALVIYDTLERVLDEGCDLLSFAGDAPYLDLYARSSLPLKRVLIFRNAWAGAGLYQLHQMKKRLAGSSGQAS